MKILTGEMNQRITEGLDVVRNASNVQIQKANLFLQLMRE